MKNILNFFLNKQTLSKFFFQFHKKYSLFFSIYEIFKNIFFLNLNLIFWCVIQKMCIHNNRDKFWQRQTQFVCRGCAGVQKTFNDLVYRWWWCWLYIFTKKHISCYIYSFGVFFLLKTNTHKIQKRVQFFLILVI